MLRSILGVVLGVIAAGIVVGVVESIGHMVYPPPAGLDASDPEALSAYIAAAPAQVLLFVMLAWMAGAFVGGLVAAWLGRGSPAVHALIVGGLMLAMGVLTMVKIPHPLWFWITGIVAVPASAYLASMLVSRRPAVAS